MNKQELNMAESPQLEPTDKEQKEFDLKSNSILKDLDSYITEYFGERCADYCDGCHTCRMWHAYDILNDRMNDKLFTHEVEND